MLSPITMSEENKKILLFKVNGLSQQSFAKLKGAFKPIKDLGYEVIVMNGDVEPMSYEMLERMLEEFLSSVREIRHGSGR